MQKKGLFHLIFAIIIVCSCSVQAKDLSSDWNTWVHDLRTEALADGIRPEVFDSAFEGVHPSVKVQHFDRTQPEKRLTYTAYRNSRIDPYKITLGRKEFTRHESLLENIGADYHVSPCVVTALWGMESSYGRYKGHFPVVASLATLSFEGRRKDFFRHELLLALRILNEHQVTLRDFKGEWAGASGHPQFLPSSWYQYAVDYDGDGKKDIWNSAEDALASIGNYLKLNGWHAGEPWAVVATLPEDFDENLFGVEHKRPVSEWLAMGVSVPKKIPQHLEASIITPEGGPALMTFHNFSVIKKYNNSTFYAGSVGYLADKICS